MKHSRSLWAFVLFTFAGVGCVASPGNGGDGRAGERPPPERAQGRNVSSRLDDTGRGAWWRIAPPPSPCSLLAWTKDGDLVVVDGATGDVTQSVIPAGLAGDHDLVYDRWQHRAVVFEGDDEGPGGEVAAYAITTGASGPTLGPRVHLASVGGDARLLPTPLGTVIFGDDGGDHWSVIWGDGTAGPTVAAPRPTSAWLTPTATGATLHALAYGASSGELDTIHAMLKSSGLATPSVAVLGASAATFPATARLVPTPARGGALLFDVEGAFVTVRHAASASVGPEAQAPLGADGLRIEAAIAFDGGKEVVLLMAGATEVVALEIDASLSIASMAKLALAGDAAEATHFVSHDLAAQGPRLIAAATSAGVFSITLGVGTTGVHLQLAPGFQAPDLRGPVDTIWDEAH